MYKVPFRLSSPPATFAGVPRLTPQSVSLTARCLRRTPETPQLPPSALTRLLGPAYDALDNDEPERALKHLKKARAQFPRLHLARALEALAVCRIDPSANRATALEMADSIRAETQRGDVTENVAHVLLLLFEETADVSRKLDGSSIAPRCHEHADVSRTVRRVRHVLGV